MKPIKPTKTAKTAKPKRTFSRLEVMKAAKTAENTVDKALRALKEAGHIEYERIPDSKSAGVGTGGNIQKARRGDFDAICNGVYTIIEVKNSLVHPSFNKLNISKTFRPSQISSAYRWHNQGAQTLALFHGTDGWYYLPTHLIAEMQIQGNKSIPCHGVAIRDGHLEDTLRQLLIQPASTIIPIAGVNCEPED